jgi:steroid 5-alpha reductase family enzyme
MYDALIMIATIVWFTMLFLWPYSLAVAILFSLLFSLKNIRKNKKLKSIFWATHLVLMGVAAYLFFSGYEYNQPRNQTGSIGIYLQLFVICAPYATIMALLFSIISKLRS